MPRTATQFVTGPVHFFASVGLGRAMKYLGTAARPPRFRIRRGFKPVFNDLRGSVVPFDMLYMGQEAFTIADMQRVNRDTLHAIQSMPNIFGAVGVNVAGDIGTLMLQESAAFGLVLFFPYYAKAAMRLQGMPQGIYLPGTILEGPDDIGMGTEDQKFSLIFHSLMVYDPKTGRDLLASAILPPLPPLE